MNLLRLKSIVRFLAFLFLVSIPLLIILSVHSPRNSSTTQTIVILCAALPVFLFCAIHMTLHFLNPHARKGAEIGLLITRVVVSFIVCFAVSLGFLTMGLLAFISGRERGAAFILTIIGSLILYTTTIRFLKFRRDTRTSIAVTLRKHGYCPHCSYDLRGSPLRCPECGQPNTTPNARPHFSF